MGRELHRYSLTLDVLRIVGAGALLAGVLVAPNLASALRPFLRRAGLHERREWHRNQMRAALERLRRRRLVEFVQQRDETSIVITERGKQRLRKFEFEAVSAAPPGRWDEKWRLVMFDIPERRKRERHHFREKLIQLGFFPLQKSVWVYPHECHDEIDFVCHFLGIDRWVHYIETPALGQAEGRVRRHFGLLI